MTPASDNGGHSLLAPSSASRWSVCTASVGFIEAHRAELDFSSSVFADEGTEAHALAASMMGGKDAPWCDNPEMVRICMKYAGFVASLRDPGCGFFIEQKVPLFYRPKDNGTVDVRIVNPEKKTIHIIDLKYGAGVSVYAKENKQLATYAESAIREMERDGKLLTDWLVTLVIYQPRDRNDDNPIRLWALDRQELFQFAYPIGVAAAKIEVGDVKFVADPTGHCFFCPAKGICEAYRNYGLEALPDESRVLDARFPNIPEPRMLTRDQRVRVILGRKALEQWLEAVEDYEVAQLMNGAEPMGVKLVAGKSNRVWRDTGKVKNILREYLDESQIMLPPPPPEETIISIVEAEKLIGKKEFSSLASFITKPDGKPTLVPVDDKRPALEFGPSRDFEDLDAKPGADFI